MGPVLLVVAHLDPKKRGSLEDQYAEIARRMVARGVAVEMVFARAPAKALAELYADAGARCHAADFSRPLVAAAQVAALARRFRPQIAHLHFLRASSPVTLAAAASADTVVMNDHMALVDGRSGLSRVLKRTAYGLLARAVHRRVAVSQHVAETVKAAEAVPADRLRVIENGISLSRFRGLDRREARLALGLPADGGTVIACVARMAHEKGVDVAIRALARLCAMQHEGPKPTLLIAGDGPDARGCASLAASLGIADQVRFLGLRSDVERILAASDQAWVPSRVPEAFGLAAAEAMAAGLPVIASRTGGLPEVVDEGTTGLLFTAGDDAQLAEAAQSLLGDPARSAEMGRAGRARAEARFSLSRYGDRVLALYQELAPGWFTDSSIAMRKALG